MTDVKIDAGIIEIEQDTGTITIRAVSKNFDRMVSFIVRRGSVTCIESLNDDSNVGKVLFREEHTAFDEID